MKLLSSLSFLRLGVWLIIAGFFLVPLSMVISLALGGNQIPILSIKDWAPQHGIRCTQRCFLPSARSSLEPPPHWSLTASILEAASGYACCSHHRCSCRRLLAPSRGCNCLDQRKESTGSSGKKYGISTALMVSLHFSSCIPTRWSTSSSPTHCARYQEIWSKPHAFLVLPALPLSAPLPCPCCARLCCPHLLLPPWPFCAPSEFRLS